MVHRRWLYTTRASNERKVDKGREKWEKRFEVSVFAGNRVNEGPLIKIAPSVVRYRWNRNKRGPRALVPILNVNISRHGQNWACYVIVDFSAPWTTASARARENSTALWNISGLLKRPLGIETCYYVHMHRTIDLKDYMNSTICVPVLCELLA